MKKIIDGKLYDTEKAELIVLFRRKVRVKNILGEFDSWASSELYKTKNGVWFEVIGTNMDTQKLSSISEDKAKEIIMLNPDKFVELYPNEVAEA
jgi:hypothetical protein